MGYHEVALATGYTRTRTVRELSSTVITSPFGYNVVVQIEA